MVRRGKIVEKRLKNIMRKFIIGLNIFLKERKREKKNLDFWKTLHIEF